MSGIKVLVVDDQESIRTVVVTQLSTKGQNNHFQALSLIEILGSFRATPTQIESNISHVIYSFNRTHDSRIASVALAFAPMFQTPPRKLTYLYQKFVFIAIMKWSQKGLLGKAV